MLKILKSLQDYKGSLEIFMKSGKYFGLTVGNDDIEFDENILIIKNAGMKYYIDISNIEAIKC